MDTWQIAFGITALFLAGTWLVLLTVANRALLYKSKFEQGMETILASGCTVTVNEGLFWRYGNVANVSELVDTPLHVNCLLYFITMCTSSSALLCNKPQFKPPPHFDASAVTHLVNIEKQIVVGYTIPTHDRYAAMSIVFHSTQTMFGAVTDFDFTQTISTTPGIHGKVHAGFDRAYAQVKDQITSSVLNVNAQSILIVGHSLGAALTQLCAAHVNSITGGKSKIVIVSFASPRVGNDEWATRFDAMASVVHHRIQNVYDLIPQLPIGFSSQMNYHHTGNIFTVAEETGVAADNHGLKAYRHGIRQSAAAVV